MDRNRDIVEALRGVMGHDRVQGPSEFGARIFWDASGIASGKPAALVLPRTTEDVSTALKCCHRHCRPVVIQGGKTGISGCATAREGEVVVSTDRLNRIEEVDPQAGTVTVQAGVTLRAVQAVAAEAGLFFPTDFGVRDSCTVGGNIATNARGYRAIRYGTMRDQVLGIEAVLASGHILTAANENNGGYDLKHLLIGSEGTLAVITKAKLKLRAAPRYIATAWVGLEDYADALHLLRMAQAQLPAGASAFEVMWSSYYDRCLETFPHLHPPLPERHGLYVLLEAADASPDQVDALFATLAGDGIVHDVAVARSKADATAFWALRDLPAEFLRLSANHRIYNMSVAVPQVDALAAGCIEGLETLLPDGFAMAYGDAGNGHLHMIAQSPALKGELADVADQIVFSATRVLDGSVNDGIGMKYREYPPSVRGSVELATMRLLKDALDPGCLLGRGRIFPPDASS